MTIPRTLRPEPEPLPSSILERISMGDKAAVRECISRHGGLVWSLARRFFADLAEAEDASQEVFIALWTNAARYDPSIASETTFVAMIARRTLIDRQRKHARRPSSAPLPENLTIDEPGPPEWLERIDEAGRAARALEALGDDQRRVLTLSIYRGLTYDQIAREIGLPLGTVKTHARRGLINLRRELEVDEPQPITLKEGGKK
jgi:RNA polymerase sigma-70 factor (ECF subfamily)